MNQVLYCLSDSRVVSLTVFMATGAPGKHHVTAVALLSQKVPKLGCQGDESKSRVR